MKYWVLTGALLLGSLSAIAALPPEIENPECLGINKEPYHATLAPYATLEQALAAKRLDSPYCRLLNGLWKFNWVKHPDLRPVDFFQPSFDVSSWKDIPVPSCWQVEGYGTPYYRNNGYIIQKDFPHVMSDPPKSYTAFDERNPVGSYRRNFELPADWSGRQVFLAFSGVDSAFYLWINGQKVGYSVNSRNTAEFDVTRYLHPGQNMVAVEVYRFSSGTWLEDQDMWRLSGLFRDVYLWSAPQVHIRDYAIQTDLDAKYQDATLQVVAKIKNYGAAATPGPLTATVYDAAGKAVAQGSLELPALAAGQEIPVSLKLPVANPAKWTAETPTLYTTVLKVGGSAELISSRTGFRKIEIKGRIFLVNGVPVKLLGVNRHEMWPDTGHTVSEAQMIRDIEVMKQGNVNHVRTCHYSDDPRWYELCDQYGLWLVAEANVECHGYDGAFDAEPRMRDAIIDRNVANVENFKNHPSVVIWSLGNECGGRGKNFIDALTTIKAIDPTRPVHYERFGRGEGNPADFDGQMYGTPQNFEATAQNTKLTKPFYICEYAHAMFNSMGSIDEYCEVFERNAAITGAAIWEWQDQGLWNKRDPKHVILAYGGGFGDVPNDHYFIHKGVVQADRSPKPHYPEMKKAYQWIGIKAVDLAAGKIQIRNRFAFATLKGFAGEWTLVGDGQEVARGTLPPMELAPGTEQPCQITWPQITAQPGVEYFLRIAFKLAQDELWAKAGHEVAWQQFKLPLAAPAPIASDTAPVSLQQDDKLISVSGAGFGVQFDKTTGLILSLQRDGRNLLASDGGPRLHLWRAAHRTDDIWAFNDWNRFGLTHPNWKLVDIHAQQAGPGAVSVNVSLKMQGESNFQISHLATYTIYGDGSIAVDNSVMPTGRKIPFARLGVRMLLDSQLDQFDYLGRGPMENYVDRKQGFDVNVYSNTVRGNMTPYAKPMECGNHEDVRWAAIRGKGLPGLMAQGDGGALIQAGALPYTDEQMNPVEYTVDLPPSSASVLTLATQTTGVGSNGCGPRPLDNYIVWSTPAVFSYVLRTLPADANLTTQGHLQAPCDRVGPVRVARDPEGHVTLSCQSPGAEIQYALDGQSWQSYAKTFELPGAARLSLRASAPGLKGFESLVLFDPLDHRGNWKLTASSFDSREGEAANVLDGNALTIWHSRWSTKITPDFPHWLAVDFGKTLTIQAVTLLPRQDGKRTGQIKSYELYLSSDGKHWGEPIAKGVFENCGKEQIVKLYKPATGRHLKLVALSEVSGQKFASLAELDVEEAKP